MRKVLWSFALSVCVALGSTVGQAQTKPDSLYKRIGGYDAIVIRSGSHTIVSELAEAAEVPA